MRFTAMSRSSRVCALRHAINASIEAAAEEKRKSRRKEKERRWRRRNRRELNGGKGGVLVSVGGTNRDYNPPRHCLL